MRSHLLLLCSAVVLVGCEATMSRSWDDDLDSMGAQRGGAFSYEDRASSGAIALIEGNIKDKAAEYCGSRKVVWTSEKSSNQLANNYDGRGHIKGLRVARINEKAFLCEDSDVVGPTYVLAMPDDGAPVCAEIEEVFWPGAKRLKSVSQNEGTDDCLEAQGWIRFVDEDRKVHQFIGPKGKALCDQLEAQLVKAQVPPAQTNTWLRAKLQCASAATH